MDSIHLFLRGFVVPLHWNWFPNWKANTGIRRGQCQVPLNSLHILVQSWGLQGCIGWIDMISHILEFEVSTAKEVRRWRFRYWL